MGLWQFSIINRLHLSFVAFKGENKFYSIWSFDKDLFLLSSPSEFFRPLSTED